MAEPIAQLGQTHGWGTGGSLIVANKENAKRYVDPLALRNPDRFIYIHTVSKRDFEINQAPLFPRLKVLACTTERCRLVATIPDPVLQADLEVWSQDIRVYGHRGVIAAQSLCNPNNATAMEYEDTPEGTAAIIRLQDAMPDGLGYGVNLNAQGVFWSLHNPPEEIEIAAAEKRRERYYSKLIENARVLELSDPRRLNDELNQDYHLAAEYFGVTTSWHRPLIKYVKCPLCGEDMHPGAAVHLGPSPSACRGVLDWDRAIAAGLKEELDRPREKTAL